MASSKDADPSLGYLTQKDAEVKILCPTTVKNESQEQALEVDYWNHTLWLKYAEFEMKKKFINHAMNVWDHVVTLLPRMDQLWINWMPDQQGWLSYIKAMFEQFFQCHPKVGAWIQFLFVTFAKFEEQCKESERARCIYKFALDHIPKGRAEDLYRKFEGIEEVIVGKRWFQYEDEMRKSPPNYDTWFDYIRLEESMGKKERIRKVFERAIANVSPTEEKWYWQFMHLYFVANFLFVFICTINYAIYEELDVGDVEWTRECLKLIPHEKFSFTKIWILIFKKFFEIELQLGNIDRGRKLYETYLEWALENCYAWCKYAELEKSLLETDFFYDYWLFHYVDAADPDNLSILKSELHDLLSKSSLKSTLLNVKTKLARYKISCLQFDDDDF
ncbi:hypothetical protein UlMin_042117 [Ulmus minor]